MVIRSPYKQRLTRQNLAKGTFSRIYFPRAGGARNAPPAIFSELLVAAPTASRLMYFAGPLQDPLGLLVPQVPLVLEGVVAREEP